MITQTGPFGLDATPIHLGTGAAVPQPDFGFDGPAFMDYIERHCTAAEPGWLVMQETTPGDWPSWERHPEGDEIVIVLAGRGEFVQEIDGEERRMPIGPGSALVNPRGVWHTADVEEPLTAVYVTPCPGTEHRPR